MGTECANENAVAQFQQSRYNLQATSFWHDNNAMARNGFGRRVGLGKLLVIHDDWPARSSWTLSADGIELMKFKQFRLITLLLAISIIALLLAVFVERQTVIGQSSTHSPDGNWCLNLRLVEHSTLFSSRKILDADIEHRTNEHWNVTTSVPFNDADAKTISNQHSDYPIVWSDDSSTVNYWINEHLEDSMEIEANDEQHIFQRRLYSTTVTKSSKQIGG